MSDVKKIGLFGNLSNSVKATASSVEVIALGVNQAAMMALMKIQLEAMESLQESGQACNSFEELRNLQQGSLAAARLSY